jgi:hypothetical protein
MKKIAKVSIIVVVLYVAAYFLLMARNAPAGDRNGKIVFRSCFRLSSTAWHVENSVIRVYNVSVWNYVFYPMDMIYYAIFPANWSLNRIPTLQMEQSKGGANQ